MPDQRSSGSSSLLLGLCSAIVGICAFIVVILSALVKNDRLSDDYFPDCHDCNKVLYVIYVFGAILMLTGILGVVLASNRSRALRIPFILLIVIGMLAFIAIMVLAIIFIKKPNSLHLDQAWAQTVSDDPNATCTIEANLQCSGYSSCCNFSTINDNDEADLSFVTVPSPSAPLIAPVEPRDSEMVIAEETQDNVTLTLPSSSCTATSDECPSNCSHNLYITPCDSVLFDRAHRYIWAIVGLSAAIIAFCFLAAIFAVTLSPGENGLSPGSSSNKGGFSQDKQDQQQYLLDNIAQKDQYYNQPNVIMEYDGPDFDELAGM